MSLTTKIWEPTGKDPELCIIWLHGLGASNDDFMPIAQQMNIPARFVFPQAPNRPVTINQGMLMPAWYDIYGLGPGKREDAEGLKQSQQALEDLIERQDFPSERIVIAGFSQGGAVALLTALQYKKPLAGIIALSTYLPLSSEFDAHSTVDIHKDIAIFMGHGQQDDIVLPTWAELSRDKLQALGLTVNWYAYDMGHFVCPQEVQDCMIFINNIIAANK